MFCFIEDDELIVLFYIYNIDDRGYIKFIIKKGQFVRFICQDIEIDKLFRYIIYFYDLYYFLLVFFFQKGIILNYVYKIIVIIFYIVFNVQNILVELF